MRRWKDQPAEVAAADQLFSAFVYGSIIAAALAPNGTYYVTVGTLFGSQTVRCEDARTALVVLGRTVEMAKQLDDNPNYQPQALDVPGATVMENADAS